MPNRISDEERILNFFKTAPLAKVEVVFNLAKSEVKNRQKQAGGAQTESRKRVSRKSAPATVETVSSTPAAVA